MKTFNEFQDNKRIETLLEEASIREDFEDIFAGALIGVMSETEDPKVIADLMVFFEQQPGLWQRGSQAIGRLGAGIMNRFSDIKQGYQGARYPGQPQDANQDGVPDQQQAQPGTPQNFKDVKMRIPQLAHALMKTGKAQEFMTYLQQLMAQQQAQQGPIEMEPARQGGAPAITHGAAPPAGATTQPAAGAAA